MVFNLAFAVPFVPRCVTPMAAEHSWGPQWIPTDFRRSDVVGFTEVRPLKKLKLASSAAWPAVQAMAGARKSCREAVLVPSGQRGQLSKMIDIVGVSIGRARRDGPVVLRVILCRFKHFGLLLWQTKALKELKDSECFLLGAVGNLPHWQLEPHWSDHGPLLSRAPKKQRQHPRRWWPKNQEERGWVHKWLRDGSSFGCKLLQHCNTKAKRRCFCHALRVQWVQNCQAEILKEAKAGGVLE